MFLSATPVIQRLKSRTRVVLWSSLPANLKSVSFWPTSLISSGVLTVQTTLNNEQLSILSSSDNGNYTLTTSGSWSGSATDITISGTSLYVNRPAALSSILVNDNSGAITGSTFSFDSSSGNFINSLTVDYAGTSGRITVGNSVRFTGSSNLSLSGRNILSVQRPALLLVIYRF